MELKISFRIAKPEDLKKDKQNLKIGRTYAICKGENRRVEGIFSIKGDEDPFILKHYLEKGWILIPENSKTFEEWIKEEHSSIY